MTTPELLLEIFGYIGTALVIISMMMTSVLKLRIFNICGSLISFTYSLIVGAIPVVVLNGALVTINLFHLIKARFVKTEYSCIKIEPNDCSLNYFLSLYKTDIEKYFPLFNQKNIANCKIFAVFSGSEIAGIIIGEQENQTLITHLDYTTPKFRNLSVGAFLYDYLKNFNILTLECVTDVIEHKNYLQKMGFEEFNKKMIKKL